MEPPTNPSTDPLIAIIIVHFLNPEDTYQCLLSVRESNYANQMIILVNNGSLDFDNTLFQSAYSGIQVVHSDVNLGFAGGSNLGIEVALSHKADYVYLLNNDTIVKSDFLSALMHAFDQPEVGIAGPAIVHFENQEQVWIAGGIYRSMFGFAHREYCSRKHTQDHIVDFVPGAAMLIKREVFDIIGLIPESFFLYFEDLVFSLKAKQAGFKTMLVGQPLVAHKISSSAGIRGSDVFTPDKAYYFARNALLMQKSEIVGKAYVITGIIGQFIFGLPVYAIFCLISGAADVIPHYLRGLLDGIRGVTGMRQT